MLLFCKDKKVKIEIKFCFIELFIQIYVDN